MKKPIAYVTDHALLRYLERVHGIDTEAARSEAGRVVDRAVEMGAGAAVIDGIRYVLAEKRIVTCVPVKQLPLRTGRMRRQRAVREDDE